MSIQIGHNYWKGVLTETQRTAINDWLIEKWNLTLSQIAMIYLESEGKWALRVYMLNEQGKRYSDPTKEAAMCYFLEGTEGFPLQIGLRVGPDGKELREMLVPT